MRVFIGISLSFLLSLSIFAQSNFDPAKFHSNAFAHRGGYEFGSENTIETILYNLENHSQAIEIDITMTKDGQMALFHDETINRVLDTDENTKISELTLRQIQQIQLRDQSKGLQFVPTLEELVDALLPLMADGAMSDFIIELDWKPHGDEREKAIDELIRILKKQVATTGEVIYDHFFVSSFYPDVLKSLKTRAPKITTAFAVNSTSNEQKLKSKLAVLFAPIIIKKYEAKIIEPNMCLVTERFVKKWKKRGVLINTYTVNRGYEKAYLKPFDIAITTNCPSSICTPDISDQMKPIKWCKKCVNDQAETNNPLVLSK